MKTTSRPVYGFSPPGGINIFSKGCVSIKEAGAGILFATLGAIFLSVFLVDVATAQSVSAANVEKFSGTCMVLRGEKVLDNEPCNVTRRSSEAGAFPISRLIYLWPSGSKTVVTEKSGRYIINGNSGKMIQGPKGAHCIKNSKSGNTFCFLKDAVETVRASPEETTCHIVTKGGIKVGPRVEVEVDVPKGVPARTGDPVEVSWRLKSKLDSNCRTPLYLIFSMPEHVRIEGYGFIVLPRGINGPFDIGYKRDQLRVIVPMDLQDLQFHGRSLVDERFKIRIFRSTEFQLDWAIVEVPRHKNYSATPKKFTSGNWVVHKSDRSSRTFRVDVGNPKVIVRDQFSTEAPQKIIVSNTGEYELRVFDGFYRILDKKTGELHIERSGWRPNFSPTSRFVAAFAGETGSLRQVEVIDLVSGTVVYRTNPTENFGVDTVAWAKRDAFLIIGKYSGDLDIVATLTDRDPFTTCFVGGADSAWDMTSITLDIDNGLIFVGGWPLNRVYSLYFPDLTAQTVSNDPLIKDTFYETGPSNYSCKAWWLVRIAAVHSEVNRGEFTEEASNLLTALKATMDSIVETHALASWSWPVGGKTESSVLSRWKLGEEIKLSHYFDPKDLAKAKFLISHNSQPVQGRSSRPDQNGGNIGGQSDRRSLPPRLAEITDTQINSLTARLDEFGLDLSYGVENQKVRINRFLFPDDIEDAAVRSHANAGLLANKIVRNQAVRIMLGTIPEAESHFIGEKYSCLCDFCTQDSKNSANDTGSGEGNKNTGGVVDAIIEPDYLVPTDIISIWNWRSKRNKIWMMQSLCHGGAGSQGLPLARLFLLRNDSNPRKFVNLGQLLEGGAGDIQSRFIHVPFSQGNEAILEVRLFRDRYLIVVSVSGQQMAVYDLDANRLLAHFRNVQQLGNFKEVGLSNDLKNLVQIGKDGRFQIYSLMDNKKVLDGYYLDDEIVVYDDRGYFDATEEGAHFVFLKFPGVRGYHSFHQFKSTLHRPDVIKFALGGGGNKGMAPDLINPPTLELSMKNAPPDGITPYRVAFQVRSDVGLKALRFYSDGQLLETKTITGREQASEVDVRISPGRRWLTAVAVDQRGFESVPKSIALPLLQSNLKFRLRLFVLSVGTNTYNHPAIDNLNYAVSDAETFARVARLSQGGYYSEVIADRPLIDSPDLKNAFLARLEKILAETRAEDTVALFVAGHGVQDKQGQFYLAGTNTDPEDLAATGLAWDSIARVLAGGKGRIILFLDACHSGGAGATTTNDDVVRFLRERHQGRAITVISASKGRQFSLEGVKYKSKKTGKELLIAAGIFSFSLEKALARERDQTDTNKNGVIELSELFRALKRRTVTLTNGRQTPWIARNQMVGMIPLF